MSLFAEAVAVVTAKKGAAPSWARTTLQSEQLPGTWLQKSEQTGMMVALPVAPEVSTALRAAVQDQVTDLEPADHITLMYLGEAEAYSPEALAIIANTVREVARDFPPLFGSIGGWGRFTCDDEKHVVYASPDLQGLTELRVAIIKALDAAGIYQVSIHGFIPHITLAYVAPDAVVEPKLVDLPLKFDTVGVWVAGVDEQYPLAKGATASAGGEDGDGEALQAALEELTKSWVPNVGPVGAQVAFVALTPDNTSQLRGEPFVGRIGKSLIDNYLKPLGLNRDQVALMHVMPTSGMSAEREHLEKYVHVELARLQPRKVVALGKEAKAFLGGLAHEVLPHPSVMARKSDKGEMRRKLARLRKQLDGAHVSRILLKSTAAPTSDDPLTAPTGAHATKAHPRTARIAKADDDKRIIYAVVLDPYQVDAHNDWIPPADVEKTAHEYAKNSRIISLNHEEMSNGVLVETSLIPYPTKADYKAAMAGEPHKVYRQPYGDDFVHSGAWVIGTELDEPLWEMYKRGDINAYSIEGLGERIPVKASDMPRVKFIDLVPVTR